MEELYDIAAVRDMVRTMQELGKALLAPCRMLALKRVSKHFSTGARPRQSF